eukprot:TRINITY_DN7482_c0_g1_i4.p1 TRINITY_DN7482_c0_g1~~TRINITY_DN7482_c0_g1_i4.p1  ORF type:complete len:182 (+),score=39.20 TRINITY_DN7482_c0_g1_i4:75-620(+)
MFWLCVQIVQVVLDTSFFFFFFKQKTAYEMQRGLVGSEMCIRDRRRVHGLVQIYKNNIVLAIEDGTIQIVKLRYSLVKFCRLFYSGQPCTKQLFKMDEECLALAWKYLLNQQSHSLPDSFYKSVSRLSFEHQAILGLLSFEQALENVKKHSLSVHILTKLCFDFNKKGDNKKSYCLIEVFD